MRAITMTMTNDDDDSAYLRYISVSAYLIEAEAQVGPRKFAKRFFYEIVIYVASKYFTSKRYVKTKLHNASSSVDSNPLTIPPPTPRVNRIRLERKRNSTRSVYLNRYARH